MAGHVDPGELTDAADRPVGDRSPENRRNRYASLVAAVVIVLALGGLVGWLGVQAHGVDGITSDNDRYLAAGRQAALDLTSVSYTDVDADMKRILDSATGAFYDDFRSRSQPFVDVVMKTQSASQGVVTAAGVQSRDGDRARVLVAVSVRTSSAAVRDQPVRSWRMNITVQDTPGGTKVSDVEFVP